jgi:hypothetical protein
VRTGEAQVRAFEAADAPGVAQLLVRVFQHKDGPVPSGMVDYLRRIYLEAPWFDAELASRVVESAEGNIIGFAGVIAALMRLHGKPIRVALTSSLAIDDRAGDPTLAARLLRDVNSGPQDATLSDRSNPKSVKLLRSLHTEAVENYSFDWLRVLRPAGMAVAALAAKFSPARALSPLVAPLDNRHLAQSMQRDDAQWSAPSRSRVSSNFTDRDTSIEELLDLVPEFIQPFELQPNWSRDDLTYILEDVARKRTLGDFHARVVLTPSGSPAGLFLYHGRRGQVAHVAQILAAPGREGAVIDRSIAHAAQIGAVAVRGRSTPNLQSALMERRAVFLPDLSATISSRNPELLQSFRNGKAFFTGLVGENWMRLNGDRF